MVTRTDAFSHVFTEDVGEAFRELDPSHGKHKPALLFPENVEKRIDHLDRLGVDEQVISVTGQRIWPNVDPEDGLEATRLANDEVRRYADQYPDRFTPIASLPFLTGEYVDEFKRCVNDLDMAGVQIFSNVNGKMLDNEDFYEFYEAVDSADVPIWIHPLDYEWHNDIDPEDYWMYSMLGWPFETTVSLARLVFNGILDEFQNLEIISHHLGGFLPYVDERMRSWVQTRQEYAGTEHGEKYSGTENIQALSEPIDSYFDRIYADTAVSSRGKEPSLRCGLEFFGEDNVLFGADLPYGPGKGVGWMEETIPALEGMNLPKDTKRKIFSENIQGLLD